MKVTENTAPKPPGISCQRLRSGKAWGSEVLPLVNINDCYTFEMSLRRETREKQDILDLREHFELLSTGPDRA